MSFASKLALLTIVLLPLSSWALLQDCTGCYPRSVGPCWNPANHVCYQPEQDGTCPTGTVSCSSTPAPTAAPPSPLPGDFPVFSVYTTEWAQYAATGSRPYWCHNFGYTPKHLTAPMYTMVNYAFTRIDKATSTIMTVEWNAESELIPETVALKQRNPTLKAIMSIGGWSFSTSTGAFAPGATYGDQDSKTIFPDICHDVSKRKIFIDSAVAYCKKWGFDGIDIDWEWPNNPTQKSDFTTLIKELRTATQAEGLMLTAAFRASPTAGKDHYELDILHNYLDYLNLMTYDYHGGSFDIDVKTQVNTPVLDCKNTSHFDITGAVKHYLSYGIPPKKILLGMATYGRTFHIGAVTDPIGTISEGPSTQGDCSLQTGLLTYYEIERFLTTDSMIHEDTTELLAAWGTYSDNGLPSLVGFDTANTHRLKVCWARAMGLGGIFVWDGESDNAEYLLKNIRNNMDGHDCSDFRMPKCTSATE